MGRFIQADTIIPGAGDSKSYDRYAYVNNNPVRYTDPSGHIIPDEIDQPGGRGYKPNRTVKLPDYSNYLILFFGPYGVGNAVSQKSTESIDSEFLTEDELNNQYPLQPLIEWAEKNGINYVLVDLIKGQYPEEGTKQEVARLTIENVINVNLEKNPDQKIILVSHSAGTVTADIIYSAMPDRIPAIVALGPVDSETNFTNAMDSKLFVGYDETNNIIEGENFHDYWSEYRIGHYNMSVNPLVMDDVIDFLLSRMD